MVMTDIAPLKSTCSLVRNEWRPSCDVVGAQVSFTMFLHCPKEELKKRLLERGETSGRADDNVETVLKRFDTFEKESLPVVEQLELLGMVSITPQITRAPR